MSDKRESGITLMSSTGDCGPGEPGASPPTCDLSDTSGCTTNESQTTTPGRIKDGQQKRILDSAARRRRARKALEALEQDNFQDDPHADLKMSKRAPKFEESMPDSGPLAKRKRKGKDFKQRFKKSFAALLEEEQMSQREGPNYLTACVPSSTCPERHFCAVCGFPSTYTCVQCGARYCSVKCLGTHQDTRCLKYTA